MPSYEGDTGPKRSEPMSDDSLTAAQATPANREPDWEVLGNVVQETRRKHGGPLTLHKLSLLKASTHPPYVREYEACIDIARAVVAALHAQPTEADDAMLLLLGEVGITVEKPGEPLGTCQGQEAVKATPSPLPHLLKTAYQAFAKGFVTSESGGDDGYCIKAKFRTLQDLQEAYSAWVYLMVHQRDQSDTAATPSPLPATRELLVAYALLLNKYGVESPEATAFAKEHASNKEFSELATVSKTLKMALTAAAPTTPDPNRGRRGSPFTSSGLTAESR